MVNIAIFFLSQTSTPVPELIADIAVNAPLKQLYSYSVPETLAATVRIGQQVKVQFGRRAAVGTILVLRQGETDGLKPLKELLAEESLLPESLIKLLRWAADYYCHPIGQVVKMLCRPISAATTLRPGSSWRRTSPVCRPTLLRVAKNSWKSWSLSPRIRLFQ